MPATAIDGRALATERQEVLAKRVAALREQGVLPCLAAVTVTDDPGWQVYQKRQAKSCEACGIDYRQECLSGSSQEDLIECIEMLNADSTVHGVIIQAPLPEPFQLLQAQGLLSPAKDVEGVNPANLGLILAGRAGMAPCTARSAFALAEAALPDLRGVEAVVIGASVIVGKPVSQLLTDAGATVALCHIDTRDVAEHSRQADLVIVAVGKPGLLTADMVKPGAVVVDVGINRIPGPDGKARIVGDVAEEVWEVASAVSPVPGGVGSLTTCILLEQTVQAAEQLAQEQPAIEGAAIARILGPVGSELPPDVTERIAGLLSRHLVAGSLGSYKSALQRRIERGLVVMDGAMGTELIARGVEAAQVAQANRAHPEWVQQIHHAYLDAGAQVLVANTFSLNRYTQPDRSELHELIRSGVHLARQAAHGQALVIGSIGPLPKVIGGEIDADEARDAFAELALVMADAGVDGFLCETLLSTAEAEAAVAGCQQASSLPVLVSRCYDRDDVVELAGFAQAMERAGAAVVGLNCAGGPHSLLPAVSRLAGLTRLPVLARPNAGYPRLIDGQASYSLRPAWMAEHALAYRAAGVRLIGGCCGVGPDHIAAVAEALAGQTAVEAEALYPDDVHEDEQGGLAVPGGDGFETMALLSGRLGAVEARDAVSSLVAAGLQGFGLDTSWPGSGSIDVLPSRLRHLQDSSGGQGVLSLAAGGLNLQTAQAALWSAHLLGIRRVLIDSGIFTAGVACEDAADTVTLLRLAQSCNAGRDYRGNRLPEATCFAIGVRLALETAPAVMEFVAAGAHFATIQPIYDAKAFRQVMSAIQDGVQGELPVLAEVLVLPDAETAEVLDNEVPALSVPGHLKTRLADNPAEDQQGVLRFLEHWGERLQGVCLLLPDARTAAAEAVLRGLGKVMA